VDDSRQAPRDTQQLPYADIAQAPDGLNVGKLLHFARI